LLSALPGILDKEISNKKEKNLCRVSCQATLGKEILKKKEKNLYRVPNQRTLDKVIVISTGAMTTAFLCRVLTRHLVKPLPLINGTRQRGLFH